MPMVAAWLEPMDVTFDTLLIKHTNMCDEALVLVWFLSIKNRKERAKQIPNLSISNIFVVYISLINYLKKTDIGNLSYLTFRD